MKKNLLVILLLFIAGFVSAQTTYYWVGGIASTNFINNSNWNTALNGSGSFRSAEAATDILIIDGTNIGGATPATGTVSVIVPALSYAGQLKLINNAALTFTCASGTDSVVISGGTGDDLVVEAGSSLNLSGAGAGVIVIGVGASGRISGVLNNSGGGHRILTQTAGGLVFAGTSSATVNSISYPFGSASASTLVPQFSVVCESGSHLYYNGGNSPMGNNSTFSAIDFKPGSNYHIRATNATGSYVNSKAFGNLYIENNTTFTADGPVFRIGDFFIAAGSSFTTHTSGNTAILGNLTVNGSLGFPSTNSNVLVFGGNTLQTISGTGTLNIPSLTIADNASVKLERDINVAVAVNVFGQLDFGSNRITGNASFSTRVSETAVATSGTLTAGSFLITNASGLAGVAGLTVSGAGIPPNTSVISFTTGNSMLTLSNPVNLSGVAVPLTFSSDTATLATSNALGFEEGTGSVGVTGTKTYKTGTSYTLNGATEKPFGISTGGIAGNIRTGHLVINAPVKLNKGVEVYGHLEINGRLTLRADDTLRIRDGAVINGNFSNANYIVTPGDASNGEQALVLYENLSSVKTIPVGSNNYYLPATITPSAPGNYAVAAIEGITNDGLVTGTPLTAFEQQRFVNAVWQIQQLGGGGNADITLQWDNALEGSSFTTLADGDIGIVTNSGNTWSAPGNTGNNSTNTASVSTGAFGVFAVGAVPQVDPFVFNELPVKTYGDVDFSGGATSLNTTQPIEYSSSNPAIASIVNGNIHITGTGTVTITASQASDGTYPAVSVDRELTINKTALVIKADDKLSPEGEPLPALTVSYTGFVYNETATVLLTAPQVSTTATSSSPVGPYPVTVTGATAANYIISFQEGVLTIQPKQPQVITFNAPAAKRYGNADFAAGGTSTNTTIPVTYTSSNTSVATITGSTIHITGAGNTTITASQAGNSLFFPAPSVARTLTVDKTALTIAVRDTSKVEGQANPAFTFVYTGFVNAETSTSLTAQPVINTLATVSSSAGYYAITPAGAASNNYAITFTPGRLTILPVAGSDRPHLNAYMPNSTTLTTRIYSNVPALTDVVLWDLNGKPFIKRNTFLPKGFISIDLMIGAVPSGVYIVTVRGSGVDLEQMIRIVK